MASAGIEAWRAAGLETSPATRWLSQLRIERPATSEAYDARCPAVLLGHSAACLRSYGWDVPVAVVSPTQQTVEQVEHAALHEWLHEAGYRFGRWPDYNPLHSDVDVWKGKPGERPNSVEQRAQRMLKERRR